MSKTTVLLVVIMTSLLSVSPMKESGYSSSDMPAPKAPPPKTDPDAANVAARVFSDPGAAVAVTPA